VDLQLHGQAAPLVAMWAVGDMGATVVMGAMAAMVASASATTQGGQKPSGVRMATGARNGPATKIEMVTMG